LTRLSMPRLGKRFEYYDAPVIQILRRLGCGHDRREACRAKIEKR
jgi:hypothetical protein